MPLKRDPFVYCIFLLPLLFFSWTLFSANTIGGDYLEGHLTEPVLFKYFSLKGLEPMWEMLRAGGIPFSGNPSSQIFHLPRWLSAMAPGFMSGHALEVLLLRHFALFVLAQVFTYAFLLRFTALGRPLSFLASSIAIYNLSFLDSFRYGISLDTLTYGLCLILSMLFFLKTHKNGYLLLILLFWQLAITASYYPTLPLIGLIGGLCALLACYYDEDCRRNWLRSLALVALAVLSGTLMAAPNLLPVTELLKVNYQRQVAADLEWANLLPLTPVSFLFNMFRPFAAEVHSGFGASTLLPLILVTVVLYLLRSFRKYWPLLLLLALPFLYALGTSTPVFVFFHEHVPGFGSIRVPGRILAFLPVVLISIFFLVKVRPERKDLQNILGLSALINLAGLLYFMARQIKGAPPVTDFPHWTRHPLFPYSPEALFQEFWTESYKMTWLAVGIIACVSYAWLARAGTSRARWVTVLFAATFLQTWMVVGHGTFQRPRKLSPTYAELEQRDFLPLYTDRTPVAGVTDPVDGLATTPFVYFTAAAEKVMNCYYPLKADQKDVGVVLPFYMSDNVRCMASEDAILQTLKTETTCDGTSVTHTYLLRQDSPLCDRASSPWQNGHLVDLNRHSRLTALTPNTLAFDVEPTGDALFVTRYPDVTSNWTAWLDGQKAPLIRVNGAFLGLNIPKGKHAIKIQYLSALTLASYGFFFAGLALALFVGLSVYRPQLRSRSMWAWSLAIAVLCTAGAWRTIDLVKERAQKEVLLSNSYERLLEEQAQRWAP